MTKKEPTSETGSPSGGDQAPPQTSPTPPQGTQPEGPVPAVATSQRPDGSLKAEVIGLKGPEIQPEPEPAPRVRNVLTELGERLEAEGHSVTHLDRIIGAFHARGLVLGREDDQFTAALWGVIGTSAESHRAAVLDLGNVIRDGADQVAVEPDADGDATPKTDISPEIAATFVRRVSDEGHSVTHLDRIIADYERAGCLVIHKPTKTKVKVSFGKVSASVDGTDYRAAVLKLAKEILATEQARRKVA